MSLLAALQARVASMLGRCLLLAVANEAGGFRKLQVQVRAGTVRDDVEQFEPYGFAASPHIGDNPQGMYAELGGAAGHPVVIVVHAPAARPRDLEPGEVAVYARFGQLFKMDADGNLKITAPGKIEIVAGGDAEIDAGGEARLRSATRTVVECNGHGTATLPNKVDSWAIGAVAGSMAAIAPPRVP